MVEKDKYDDRIAKERMNVILVVDTSTSMKGERIAQVNAAIHDIKDYLIGLEKENSNVDFYMSIISFSTESEFYKGEKMIRVSDLNFDKLRVGGWSNLDKGYESLEEILKKESKGGIMPDFGGVAPVILVLTDGHPTTEAYKDRLDELRKLPWFRASLRYGIAIELNDKRTIDCLEQFTGNAGEVVKCYNQKMLKDIIKIIVMTASKVKSQSSNVSCPSGSNNQTVLTVQQEISEALSETENLEW